MSRPYAVRGSRDPHSWRLVLFLDGGYAWQPVDKQYAVETAGLFHHADPALSVRMTVCTSQPTEMYEATYLWCRVRPFDTRPGVTGTAPVTVTDVARLTPQVPNMCMAAVHHPLIVAHEVGHMLGLGHNDEDGHVMSWLKLGPRWAESELRTLGRNARRFCDYWFLARNGTQLIYPKFDPGTTWDVETRVPALASLGVAMAGAAAGVEYECPWGRAA